PELIPREEAEIMRPIPGPEEQMRKGEDGDEDEHEDGARHGKQRQHSDARAEASPREHVVPGILLGEELYARTLRVFMGSDVDVACPLCGVGPSGAMPKLKPFRVAGHFYTGMYEFDSKLAYVSLAEAQKFLGMQGEVTGIEVRTVTPDVARDVAD